MRRATVRSIRRLTTTIGKFEGHENPAPLHLCFDAEVSGILALKTPCIDDCVLVMRL
jgi:hypothetical protein